MRANSVVSWDNRDAPEGADNTTRGLTRSLDLTKEGLAMKATRTNPQPEVWRTVPSATDYSVSDQGRVRRDAGGARARSGRVLRPIVERQGYVKVHVAGRTRRVHQLVAEAFIGPRPEGLETCHNNGDRSDNRPSNLRYDSPTGNSADRILHGTANRGERHGLARLTESDVRTIRARLAEGWTNPEVAAAFGVSRNAISKIRTGVTWSWLDADQGAA